MKKRLNYEDLPFRLDGDVRNSYKVIAVVTNGCRRTDKFAGRVLKNVSGTPVLTNDLWQAINSSGGLIGSFPTRDIAVEKVLSTFVDSVNGRRTPKLRKVQPHGRIYNKCVLEMSRHYPCKTCGRPVNPGCVCAWCGEDNPAGME